MRFASVIHDGQPLAVTIDGDLRFRPVVPNPGKVLCIGLNYLAHIQETQRDESDYPSPSVPGRDLATDRAGPPRGRRCAARASRRTRPTS
jgi:2-keto-4-pentenoate hydratase/2-oxohepta-3-ene-1,7-dioic acid hydratase in catechol pathway